MFLPELRLAKRQTALHSARANSPLPKSTNQPSTKMLFSRDDSSLANGSLPQEQARLQGDYPLPPGFGQPR
jgi:hypothetical protein